MLSALLHVEIKNIQRPQNATFHQVLLGHYLTSDKLLSKATDSVSCFFNIDYTSAP